MAAAIELLRIGVVGRSSGAVNGLANLEFESSSVEVLVVADANPLYSMPQTWRTLEAFKKVPFVVWAGTVPDETAELRICCCRFIIHWSRGAIRFRAPACMASASRSCSRSSRASRSAMFSSRSRVRAAARRCHGRTLPKPSRANGPSSAGGKDANEFWVKSLTEGGTFTDATPAKVALKTDALKSGPNAPEIPKLALYTYPHPFLYDGRGADKPWLQEIPEPVTQIVWDSWAEIHPETAQELGVTSNQVVEVRSSEGAINVPVLVSGRVARGTIAVPLGQGHTAYGRYAKNRGGECFHRAAPTSFADRSQRPRHRRYANERHARRFRLHARAQLCRGGERRAVRQPRRAEVRRRGTAGRALRDVRIVRAQSKAHVGHDHRPQRVHRMQRMRRGLLRGEQRPDRRQGDGGARGASCRGFGWIAIFPSPRIRSRSRSSI